MSSCPRVRISHARIKPNNFRLGLSSFETHACEGSVRVMFANITRLAAALSIGAVALAGCGSSEDAEASDDAVHIVYTPFDEGVAATYLWKHIFEEQGYD